MEKKRVGNNTIVDKKIKQAKELFNNTYTKSYMYIQPNNSGSDDMVEEMDNCGDEYDG